MKEESRVLELYATIYSTYRIQRRPLVALRKQWDMSMSCIKDTIYGKR